jgi:hypothetical protein
MSLIAAFWTKSVALGAPHATSDTVANAIINSLRISNPSENRSECVEPIIDLFADLVLRIAVSLLELAFELIAPSIDGGEIVIGELAPLLYDSATDLFPVAGNSIPIHF